METAIEEKNIDFFICHASEDKQDFVKDFANYLILCGANVFYDDYSIKLGDSLTEKINQGLAICKNAIIVLSNYFFEKNWTQAELHAIFNKYVNQKIRIILVFHNIQQKQVADKYPLLADIVGIDSKLGKEKLCEQIFNSVGFAPKLSFGKIDLSTGEDTKQEGWNVQLRIIIPLKFDWRIPKVLLEVGTPNEFNNRLRLILKWNKRLYFEIVDLKFHHIGLSIDISSWNEGEAHYIIANIDKKKKHIYLMDNGIVKDELQYKFLHLSKNLTNFKSAILGCSLELDYPSSAIFSGLSFGTSFEVKDSIKATEINKNFNNMLNR